MKKNRILILLFVSVFLTQGISLFAKNNTNFSILDGEWELFIQKTPEQVFDLIDNNQPADSTITVPNFWNKKVYEFTGINNPRTYGCYRYQIKDYEPYTQYALLIKDGPATSCAIYINRELVAQNGYPELQSSSTYKGPVSQVKPVYGSFYTDEHGDSEIVIFINNRFYRKSGLWDSVLVGKNDDIFALNTILMSFSTFIAGIFVFIFLLNMIQFSMNKGRKEYIYLGIISLVLAFRISTAGYCSLAVNFPGLSAELKIKLEYLVMWVVPVALIQMVTELYPPREISIIFKPFKEKYLRYSIIIACLCTGMCSLILPAAISNRLVPVLQIFTGIFSVYIMIFIIIDIIRKEKHIMFYLFSTLVLIIGGTADIIYTKSRTTLPMSIFPFFLVLFMIMQIIFLATIQNDIYKETNVNENKHKIINDAYRHFVPVETKKALNDYSDSSVTILSFKMCYANKKQEISSEETYLICKEYLDEIVPSVAAHNGYVNKFLPDGFTAVFPESENEAVTTAFEIIKTTLKINAAVEDKEQRLIPRIGIHYGILEENNDNSAVQETAGTVSNIVTVCEKLNKKIIISQELYNHLDENQKVLFTEMETVSEPDIPSQMELFELV